MTTVWRRRLIAACIALLLGWNGVVVAVTLVSDSYIELREDTYRLAPAEGDWWDHPEAYSDFDGRVLIDADCLAFISLSTIGFVNLGLVALLLIFLTTNVRDEVRATESGPR